VTVETGAGNLGTERRWKALATLLSDRRLSNR
jgi:hypothetical protein